MVDDGDTLFARFNWDHTAFPYVPKVPSVTFKDIHILPEPEFPTGRKGLSLARYWQQQQQGRERIGILLLDGDVLADPEDIRAMRRAIGDETGAVHTAPVKLWYQGEWVWSHQGEDMQLTKECLTAPYYFSFGLTYIPAAVMNAAIKAGLDSWYYPYVDENVSHIARKIDVPVRVVLAAYPKHIPMVMR
jgi:hypothetical protein